MAQGKQFNMEEEFVGIEFHSIRLEKRFIRTMETLIQQPDASIWEASENRAEAKAICRMLANEDFDRQEIIRAHREATIRRMAGGEREFQVAGDAGTEYGGYSRRGQSDNGL